MNVATLLGLAPFAQPADASVHGMNSGSSGLVGRLSGAGSGVAAFLEQEAHQVSGHCALGEASGLKADEFLRPGYGRVENGISGFS